MIWAAVYAFAMPLALALLVNWPAFRTDATAAAWVQAIGSILAVAAAASIAIWQSADHTHRKEAAFVKERQLRLQSIARLALHLAKRMDATGAAVTPAPANTASLLDAVRTELGIASETIKEALSAGYGLGVLMPARVSVLSRLAFTQLALEIQSTNWTKQLVPVPDIVANVVLNLNETRDSMNNLAPLLLKLAEQLSEPGA